MMGLYDFQSHFGLILSPASQIVAALVLPFNPILVWFYREKSVSGNLRGQKLSIPFWSDFIFQFNDVLIPLIVFFQSHFGLILSIALEVYKYMKSAAFNPILVWFYRLERDFETSSFVKPFNPILVWFYHELLTHLQSVRLSLSIPFWSDFIHGRSIEHVNEYPHFQSHFGLILSPVL